jgi:hypothetical protein
VTQAARKQVPFNAADKESVAQRDRDTLRKREGELADIRAAMADGVASRVLWRVLERCHVYQTSFTGHGSRDSFLEGERNIGLFLISEMIEADPKGYANLLTKEKSRDV